MKVVWAFAHTRTYLYMWIVAAVSHTSGAFSSDEKVINVGLSSWKSSWKKEQMAQASEDKDSRGEDVERMCNGEERGLLGVGSQNVHCGSGLKAISTST